MQPGSKLFDDFAALATGAAGAMQGVRQEFETFVLQQADKMVQDMDLVSREEFEVVRAMAEKAREENVALTVRIEALEAKLEAKD